MDKAKDFPTTYSKVVELVSIYINKEEIISNKNNHEPFIKDVGE